MKRLLPALIAAALGCSALHAAPLDAASSAKRPDRGTYIVTFDAPGLAAMAGRQPVRFAKSAGVGGAFSTSTQAARDYRSELALERHAYLAAAERLLGRAVAPRYVYDVALNGVALELTRAEARMLSGLDGVKRVEAEQVFRPQTDRGPAWIGAPAIWDGPPSIANKGEGVVVGVIDSGINRTHPSFAATGPVDGFVHANPRGRFYGRCEATPAECNAKLIGIYDFTDEGAQNGIDVDGHGTHVASTAVGNFLNYTIGGSSTRISGVAPHAALITYKVCVADDPDTEDDEATCQGGAILQALDQVIEDGVDVVNFSIGGGIFDPWTCIDEDCDNDGDSTDIETSSEAFLNVHAAGIVAVTSAGNDGPDVGTATAPGISPWIITVAATKHDRDGDEEADELAGFSSRGPGPLGGYLVPDVSAPGVSIIAASNEGTDAASMSGTSMASPHVAGGAALLIGAHPDWTVGDVASALITTARPVVRLEDGVTPAALFDQGAGVVDLSKAVNAGLSLRIEAEDYRAGHPRFGGTISSINEPALILDECFRTCTVTRTFTGLTTGTWRIVTESEPGVVVNASPAEFSLAVGASREVTFSVNAEARAGEWTYGAVRLQRTDGASPEARLPLGVFADPGPLPAEIVVQADADAGFVDIQMPGLIALPGASFATTGLAEVMSRTENLRQDPTQDTPYDAYGGEADGTFLQLVTVPANSGELTLRVETPASTSNDVDLFVGRDISRNGKPEENELSCSSTSPIEQELCVVEVANRGQETQYWILVQNWDAGGTTDAVTVRWTLADADAAGDGALTVTGPGHVASGQPFTIRVSWKDFTLVPGEQREGELLIGATPDRLGQTARVPLRLVRTGGTQSAASALVPGEPLELRLVAGEAEDRLYVDVPPNASSLTVTLAGSGEVDVYAAHAPGAGGPVIAAAPARSAAAARTSAAGAGDTLTISGAQLQPGRWYLTPVNGGNSTASVAMATSLAYATDRPVPKVGAYFNTERSGAGGFLYRAGNAWAYIWYTYLQDGTPTWYLGANASPGPQEGTWVVPLERYTWDGAESVATRVGEGVLTLKSDAEFQFNWNLDGQSGSETYTFIDGGGCAPGQTNDLTGSWYAPALPGYGFSVNFYSAAESVAAYFYDGIGVARWALGVAPLGQNQTIVVSQYQGTGPLAAYVEPTSTEIGTFDHVFSSQTSGQGALDADLVPPLSGSWSTDHALQKLTDNLGCN